MAPAQNAVIAATGGLRRRWVSPYRSTLLPVSDPTFDEFLAMARHAGLTFTAEEAPRLHDAWLQTRQVLLSRLPAAPDLASEPALVFVPADAGVAR